MVKFWFKVGMVAACLAAVVMVKMYLSDLAGSSSPADWSDRAPVAHEVQTQATGDSGDPSGL